MHDLLSRILFAVRTGDASRARFWSVLLVRAALWSPGYAAR